MLPLKGCTNNYDWGKDAQGEVAKLARANGSAVDDSKLYSELWMGVHPHCPSKVVSSGETLEDWVKKSPQSLGEKVKHSFGTNLPFLFKVLSVGKVLPLQTHPDKQLAGKLHRQNPETYSDENHKPEMALALTDFEALCGLITLEQLQAVLRSVPELLECVGEGPAHVVMQAGAAADKQVLTAAFQALMHADHAKVSASVHSMVARLTASAGVELTPQERVALHLNQQYPGDVGVLASFFMNLITLKPGQAVFLPANHPHAYISGDIIELQASSDNTIKGALTADRKDVEALCASLARAEGTIQELSPVTESDGIKVYRPATDELELHAVEVASGKALQLPRNAGPQILLVRDGVGAARASVPSGLSAAELKSNVELQRGGIFFIPAGAEVTLTAQQDLSIWGATCNSRLFSATATAASNGSAAAM